jgi:hypothetical protein
MSTFNPTSTDLGDTEGAEEGPAEAQVIDLYDAQGMRVAKPRAAHEGEPATGRAADGPRAGGREIAVAEDGSIVATAPEEPGEGRPLTRLSANVFSSGRPSLDAISRAVAEARQTGSGVLRSGGQDLAVTPDGNIVQTDPVADRQLTQLTDKTFAAAGLDSRPGSFAAARRAVAEGRVNATLRHGDWDGFLFQIRPEHFEGRYSYTFFAYLDTLAGLWFALLVDPRLEVVAPSAHAWHLFSDGTACLTDDVGCPTFEEPFARSALWSLGVTFARLGFGFQFNPGQ